jgi:lysophospholipase L1-like esterase
VGINSSNWNKKYRMMSLDARTVVISLGTNDYSIDTKSELNKLRSRIKSKKVYWIMPAIKPEVQKIVQEIAKKHNDLIVKIPSLSKDGYHPTRKGYQKLGEITQ